MKTLGELLEGKTLPVRVESAYGSYEIRYFHDGCAYGHAFTGKGAVSFRLDSFGFSEHVIPPVPTRSLWVLDGGDPVPFLALFDCEPISDAWRKITRKELREMLRNLG